MGPASGEGLERLQLGPVNGRRILLLGDDDLVVRRALSAAGAIVSAPALDGTLPRIPPSEPEARFDIAVVLAGVRLFPSIASTLSEVQRHLGEASFVALVVDVAPSRDNGLVLSGPHGRQAPHPTYRLVTEGWLQGYAFRRCGSPRKHTDSDLQRHTLHAFPKLQQVLLIPE